MILFILVLATVLGIGKSKAESIEPSDEQLDIAKYAVHLLKRPCSPQEKKTENVKSFDFEKEISNYASLPCSAEVKKVENFKKWDGILSFDVFIDPKMNSSISKGPLHGKNDVIKCSMEVDYAEEPGLLQSECKIDPPIFSGGTSSKDMLMDNELENVVMFGLSQLPFPCPFNTYIGIVKRKEIDVTIKYPKNCYNIGEEPSQDPPAKEECTIIVDKEKNMTRLRDCKVLEPSDAHLEMVKSAIAQFKPNSCSIEIKEFDDLDIITHFSGPRKHIRKQINIFADKESPENCSNSGLLSCTIIIRNEIDGECMI